MRDMFGEGATAPKWLGAPIEEVANASPLVALARAMKIPLTPYLLNIRATFNDTTTTIGPYTWGITGGNAAGGQIEATRLSQFAIVDRVVYEIDQPNAFPGAQMKSLYDFFFRFQSAITATMLVDGSPRFSVSSDFTPLPSLVAMMNEQWMYGWVLGYTQSVKMQFNPSALLTTPTTVTVTFRTWQAAPDCTFFTGMTNGTAIDKLQQMGVSCGYRTNNG